MPDNMILNGEHIEELRLNGNKVFAEVSRRDALGHEIDKFYLPRAQGQEKLVSGVNIASINNISLLSNTNFEFYTKDKVYSKGEVDYQLNSKLSLSIVQSLPNVNSASASTLYLETGSNSLYVLNNRTWIKVGITLPNPPSDAGVYALTCSVSNSGAISYLWSNATTTNNSGSGGGNNDQPQPDEPPIVVEKHLQEIYIQTMPRVIVYDVDGVFTTTGITVKAIYSDNTETNVTSFATYSEPDMTTAGVKTITVSYTDTELDESATTTFTITVNAPIVEVEDGSDICSINFVTSDNNTGINKTEEFTADAEKTYYFGEDDTLELSGLSITPISKVYTATTNGLKLGTGSAGGSFTINFGEEINVQTVHVYAYKYGSDSTKLSVTIDGCPEQDTAAAISADSENDCKFNANTTSSFITIKTKSNKRVYISKVVITSNQE